jgi:adenylate cyclase
MQFIVNFVKKISKTNMAIIIGVFVGFLFFALDFFGFAAPYENKLIDLRFSTRDEIAPSIDDEVIIVAIDDQSFESLKVRWPWPRDMYAKAIDRLSDAGARVIAFDLIFSEPSKEELVKQDEVFGDAIVRSKAWIVLGSKFYMKQTSNTIEKSYVAPIPNIDPGKTHVGYVNQWPDSDGITRHAGLLRKHQGQLYHSFALKILSRFYSLENPAILLTDTLLKYGPMNIKVARDANMLINYRGGPGKFRVVSFENVFDDEIFPDLKESGVFEDKIILIGPMFLEAQDYHPTPYVSSQKTTGVSSGQQTPGVEIHASILDTIMQEKYIVSCAGWYKFLIFIVLAISLALICVRLRPVFSFLILMAWVVLYGSISFNLFRNYDLIIPVFNPFLALFGTYLVALVYRLFTSERQSRYIKGVFSRYVSPKVVDQLVKDPNAELKLGGNQQNVTVLFSDIRGFTTMSEQLKPAQVVELLNEYFQTWTDIIFKHDGTVDKFIGDAVMAIFGAPVEHEDDPVRAVKAALEMKAALHQLNSKWEAEGKPTFKIGVGLNTGEAIVGNMGSQQAMGYTVIGDTVNVASRLESKTKDFGAFLLISEQTYQYVKDIIEVEEHTGVQVKGRAGALSVYEVLGLKE